MDQIKTTAASATEGRLKMDVAGKKKAKLKAMVKSKIKGGKQEPGEKGGVDGEGKADKAMDAMKMAKYRFGGKGGK